MILEEYPEAKIAVIDSTFDTVLQGLFVLEACRLRDLGLEYEQITEALLSIRESGRIFFTIGSIDYLKHGGRIGKLAGIAASALKIKPLITLKEGEIFNSGITRSRQKSMQKVVEMTEKYLDEVQAKPGEYSFCIGYGYDYEEAVGFRELLKDLIRAKAFQRWCDSKTDGFVCTADVCHDKVGIKGVKAALPTFYGSVKGL